MIREIRISNVFFFSLDHIRSSREKEKKRCLNKERKILRKIRISNV